MPIIRASSEDTSLRSSTVGDNMGAHIDLHLEGNNNGAWQVALVRFEVSALPHDVAITGATLSLWSLDWLDPGTIDVHALSEAWIEGPGDYTSGVCNWIDRLDATPWSTEGAGVESYDSTVLATFTVDEAWAQLDIALPPAIIENWRDDPGANFGLLMRSARLTQAVYVQSSEAPDEIVRPLLVVTYAP